MIAAISAIYNISKITSIESMDRSVDPSRVLDFFKRADSISLALSSVESARVTDSSYAEHVDEEKRTTLLNDLSRADSSVSIERSVGKLVTITSTI